MPIPARILRALVEDLPGYRYRPTQKEMERENRIVAAATMLMARFGAGALTMRAFALAMRMSPTTIRRHFPDMESLLAEILFRHLRAISKAIGEAPQMDNFNRANPGVSRRAAYIRATRTAFNAPTEAHLLLTRERHTLPPDLAGPIEELRLGIGDMIAGEGGEIALSLLDTPYLQAHQIEAMLAAIEKTPTEHPTPAKIPAPTEANPLIPTHPKNRPRHRPRHGPH